MISSVGYFLQKDQIDWQRQGGKVLLEVDVNQQQASWSLIDFDGRISACPPVIQRCKMRLSNASGFPQKKNDWRTRICKWFVVCLATFPPGCGSEQLHQNYFWPGTPWFFVSSCFTPCLYNDLEYPRTWMWHLKSSATIVLVSICISNSENLTWWATCGVLECWDAAMLTSWNTRMLESWNPDMLEWWNA